MGAGRPRKVDPGTLYAFAHQFYWDFRRLAEGRTRFRFDREEYARLKAEPIGTPIQFSPHEEARLRRRVEQEVRAGHWRDWQKADRLLDLKRQESRGIRDFMAEESAMKKIKIPGEPEVLEVLLAADTTAKQIRKLCKNAFMRRTLTIGSETREVEFPAWPIPLGSPFPRYLSDYAEQYVAALRDPRFPRCDPSTRPSNRLKQFWFLSRALAGALYGVTTRTAINLVGSLRPEQMFYESREGKRTRRQRKPKKYSVTRRH